MTLEAIDCQSFAGGFTLGVVQAGFELVGKREESAGFGITNCENNRQILGYRWRAEATEPQNWTPYHVPFVFGNPPCSGFSVFTGVQSLRGPDSHINKCMWHFVEFAARCHPEVAVFESVQGAYKQGRELMQALRARLEALTGHRYELYHVLQDAYELGGAAVRPRYFWVASRVPFGVEYPTLSYYPMIEDVWRDLDGMDLTWEKQPYRRPPTSTWTVRARNGQHSTDGHIGYTTQHAVKMRDLLYAMRAHGGWPARTGMYQIMRFLHDEGGGVPDSCTEQVKTYVEKEWKTGWTQPFRWSANEPGRVIVGGALSLAIHPWEDRLITHREAARLMGFPDDWLIAPSKKSSHLGPGWGKGITVDCGRWLATWVKRSLEGSPGAVAGELIGDRERLIVNPVKTTRGKVLALSSSNGDRGRPVVDVAAL
jgi:DNA (cytosine-5)-methyltransferase 1